MDTFWAVALVLGGAGLLIGFTAKQARDDRTRLTLEQQTSIVCKRCHQVGAVGESGVRRKNGSSGGKATGAPFTGVASVLFAGLSRKENKPAVSCWNCGMRSDET